MDELAPGIRQEVIDNGYSHAAKIMAALARREAVHQRLVKPTPDGTYVWDPVAMTHTRISLREEG